MKTALVGGALVVVGIVIVVVTQTASVDERGRVKVGQVDEAKAEVCADSDDPNECLPEITFEDVDGNTISPASLEGKVVMVNFWATWCAPCKKEIPALAGVYDRYKDEGFVLLGVQMDYSNRPTFDRFAKMTGINFPVIPVSEEVSAAYGDVKRLPTTYLYDREGKLYMAHTGSLDEASLDYDLTTLIGR